MCYSRKGDAAPIHEIVDKQIQVTFQAQIEQLGLLIGVNQLREKANIVLKTAAVKLSSMFKKKLQQVSLSFEEDVNRKLKKLTAGNE